MENLERTIENTTTAIEERYFKLPVSEGPSVYRERVYCYELYHQMRRLWPIESDLTLNAEIAKTGHPVLRNVSVHGTIPDFLVHDPGGMQDNFCIMEVKSSGLRLNDALQDLDKICRFQSEAGYRYGIFLIFGEEAEAKLQNFKNSLGNYSTPGPVDIWVHEQPMSPARIGLSLGS